jgi:predicted RNase H-like nuclease (RuvC/YqgF family)
MVIREESVIQLRISSMADAFDDEGRKYAVRLLAHDVAAIEAERDQLRAQIEILKAANDDVRRIAEERNRAEMEVRSLSARVEELEAARTKASANSLANMLAHEEALRRIDELNSECDGYMSAATAWKMYSDRLEIAGDRLATVTLRNGRSHEQWHAAKETKP